MQRMTIRTQLGLQALWQEQSKSTEGDDTAVELGRRAVQAMFPHGAPSPFIAEQLTQAVARVERCRAEDTDGTTGQTNPQPMTRSTLESGEVHESVAHLPQNVGAFDMDPDEWKDEWGRLLNKWNNERRIWEPIDYKD